MNAKRAIFLKDEVYSRGGVLVWLRLPAGQWMCVYDDGSFEVVGSDYFKTREDGVPLCMLKTKWSWL